MSRPARGWSLLAIVVAIGCSTARVSESSARATAGALADEIQVNH